MPVGVDVSAKQGRRNGGIYIPPKSNTLIFFLFFFSDNISFSLRQNVSWMWDHRLLLEDIANVSAFIIVNLTTTFDNTFFLSFYVCSDCSALDANKDII